VEGSGSQKYSTSVYTPLRHHHEGLFSKTHASLIEVLVAAASDLPPPARLRPGLGPPCPLAQLKRVLPPPDTLQPHRTSGLYPTPGSGAAAAAAAGAPSTGGAAPDGGVNLSRTSTNSPFIFNPYAGKRKELEQKQRGKKALRSGDDIVALLPEWVGQIIMAEICSKACPDLKTWQCDMACPDLLSWQCQHGMFMIELSKFLSYECCIFSTT
jgi:hypothetical protein